jgi:hypothetical protein
MNVKFSRGKCFDGGSALAVERTSSEKRDVPVAEIRNVRRESPNRSLINNDRSCQSALSGGSSMTNSRRFRRLLKCFRKTAILDASPVRWTCCSCRNAPFDCKSPVNLRADLRISEKSTSSPEKTPLSVDPTELGVESPERERMLSKKPSTAITDLPVKSSCRLCSFDKDAAHLPMSCDKAPGAARTTFSNWSCERIKSVKASGRLVGEEKENVESRVRLDMSVRKELNWGSFVPTSRTNACSSGFKNREQRSKPAGVSAFQWSSSKCGRIYDRNLFSSMTGKIDEETLFAASLYVIRRTRSPYARSVFQSSCVGVLA